MNALDLKNSILQLAIQGKLVEQREEEGTAKELIEQINAEKEELIKQKVIKRQKNLPEITDDEILFDIPESWGWERLESITYSIGNKSNQIKQREILQDGKFPVVSQSMNIVEGYSNEESKILKIEPLSVIVFGDHSKTLKLIDFDFIIGADGTKIMVPISMNPYYLYYVLNYNIINMRDRGYSRHFQFLKEKLVPIPPLEEQKRIVAKIEELVPYIENYDKAYSEVEELNKKFPEDMQKSILQYAIKGKLAEQREEEGTAEELYQRIQEEKEKLVKEGNIKKTKALPEISEEEIPFDIPESWKWVRLEDICEYIQRGKSPKYSDVKKYPVVAQKCNQWSGFSLEKAKFVDPNTISSYQEERFLVDGDLMWNSTGLGTLGRVAIYEEDKNPYELAVADSHVTVIRPLKQYISYKYLYYYIANPSVQNVIEEQSSGSTKQIELATNTVKNYIVPLPPQDEQKRIVERIEELLPYSKQLVK